MSVQPPEAAGLDDADRRERVLDDVILERGEHLHRSSSGFRSSAPVALLVAAEQDREERAATSEQGRAGSRSPSGTATRCTLPRARSPSDGRWRRLERPGERRVAARRARALARGLARIGSFR